MPPRQQRCDFKPVTRPAPRNPLQKRPALRTHRDDRGPSRNLRQLADLAGPIILRGLRQFAVEDPEHLVLSPVYYGNRRGLNRAGINRF